jgi:uncharacterized repeat protein (TIGR01451 family)
VTPTTPTPTRTPAPGRVDLSISKQAYPNPVGPGQTLRYSLVVLNGGPGIASDVTITDPLPAGTVFVSCAPSQGTCTGPPVGQNGTVTFNLGTLVPGASATATIHVQVTATFGQLVNTATVTTSSDDTNPDNDASTSTSLIGGSVPTLSPEMLALLAGALAGLAVLLLRRGN